MARTYSQVPEPRFVEAAKQVIPDGQANGAPVDLDTLVARQVPAPITGKYLHAKTSSGKTVMEWTDAPTELPVAPGDASEKTYALQLVQGVLTWVEVTG